jgi:hypothetical protein
MRRAAAQLPLLETQPPHLQHALGVRQLPPVIHIVPIGLGRGREPANSHLTTGRHCEDYLTRSTATMTRIPAAVVVLFLALCAIYLPDVGHGFIRDDVGWVGHNELSSWSDVGAVFHDRAGVFRPAVSASFAVERRACGTSPMCYGLTNFLLLLAGAVAIALLASALGLPSSAAARAAAHGVLYWHGISSAVLWISGRSALLLVLFSALSASEFVRGRWLTSALLAGAAMSSKEEAVLLPAALLGWAVIDARLNARLKARAPAIIGFAIASAAVGLAYFVLRSRSGALTAASAPAFYRLDFSPTLLLSKNLPEYLDRSLTFTAATLLLFWLAHLKTVHTTWNRHRRLFWFATVWWLCGFAITIFIPVRSSLYACAPSIGFAILAAGMIDEWSAQLDDVRRRRVIIAGLAIPFLLWPVYHFRNKDLVDATDVSARTMAALQRVADQKGANAVVVIEDDRSRRASVDTALGTGLQDAVDLLVKPRVAVWLDPPPADADLGGITRAPEKRDVTLRLENGQLVDVSR